MTSKNKFIVKGWIEKGWLENTAIDYSLYREPCFHYWHPLIYKKRGTKKDNRVKIVVTIKEV